MIFTLSILINLCCLVALFLLNKQLTALRQYCKALSGYVARVNSRPVPKINYKQIEGLMNRTYTKAAIAEKMGERAFNMASASNLGVIALQKALVVPRIMTRAQQKQNQLAKNGVDKLFTTKGGFDFLKPVLSDEDLEILEKMEEVNGKVAESE